MVSVCVVGGGVVDIDENVRDTCTCTCMHMHVHVYVSTCGCTSVGAASVFSTA